MADKQDCLGTVNICQLAPAAESDVLVFNEDGQEVPGLPHDLVFIERISSTEQNDLLAAINQKRAAGAKCGSVVYPKAVPLMINAKLTSAANSHAESMV